MSKLLRSFPRREIVIRNRWSVLFFVFLLLLGTLLEFPPHRRVLSKERGCVDLAIGTPETAKDVIIKHANDPFYPGQGSRACAEGRVESRFFFSLVIYKHQKGCCCHQEWIEGFGRAKFANWLAWLNGSTERVIHVPNRAGRNTYSIIFIVA